MENILINLKGDYVANSIFKKDLISVSELLEKIVELESKLEILNPVNQENDYEEERYVDYEIQHREKI